MIVSILPTLFSTAQVYDFVVAKDGTGNFTTIQAALDAVPASGVRNTIFIKKGIYEEKVFLGNRWVEQNNKIVSLIGEHPDSVVITWSDYLGKSIPYPGKTTNITADGLTCPTFTVTGLDFYMENITVKNPSTTAQAVALYQTADRQILKNCKILGNQDTHRTKKGRRFFYYKTDVEGGVDFIYAGGTAYFYQCNIISNRNGYITAPEDITYMATLSTGKTLRYGFFFKDCDLLAKPSVSAGSVYLGRPWGPQCGSIFLECRLGNHINTAGWAEMSGNSTSASFGEYKSLNATGTALVPVGGRVNWSMQLTEADVNNYLLLQKIYAAVTTSSSFDPVSMVIAPTPVGSVVRTGQSLSWNAVSNVKGYVVYANGSVIGFTTSTNYTDTATRSTPALYTVRSVGMHGNLSVPDGAVDLVTAANINLAINTVETSVQQPQLKRIHPILNDHQLLFEHATDVTLFNLFGKALFHNAQVRSCDLSAYPSGLYLVKANDALNGSYAAKIQFRR